MKTLQEKWNNGDHRPCDWDEVADFVEYAISSAVEASDNEFRKTLNSGRKMYEIGKKDERERIKSDLLKVADEIEGEELRSEVERYFKTIE